MTARARHPAPTARVSDVCTVDIFTTFPPRPQPAVHGAGRAAPRRPYAVRCGATSAGLIDWISAKYGCCSARSADILRSGWYCRICWWAGAQGSGATTRGGQPASEPTEEIILGARPAYAQEVAAQLVQLGQDRLERLRRVEREALDQLCRGHAPRRQRRLSRGGSGTSLPGGGQRTWYSGISVTPGHVSSVGVPHTVHSG